MESINHELDHKKENDPNTLEWLRLQLHTRLEEQWKMGNIPLSDIAKELKTYPIVSFLYDSKTINPDDQPDREWIPMYTESEDFKKMFGFIYGNQKNISEQEKSSYLTFEKKGDWMLVNLVKIEPSKGKWLVWVKKLTVKEFADFAHKHSQN